MKKIALLLCIVSFVSGLVSAYYWLRASKISIIPASDVESGEMETVIMGWVTGNVVAFTESGNLNKFAARWSAVTVVAGSLASLLGNS